MQKLLLPVLLGLLLTSCTFVHKMDIEQGNIITPEMTRQLHPGMSLTQVKNMMGSPLLLNTFSDQRVTYVYTMQPGGGRMSEKYVTLTFHNGILKTIDNHAP